MVPSSLITSPLSISFSMRRFANAAYSGGWPRRGGKDLLTQRDACSFGESAQQGRFEDSWDHLVEKRCIPFGTTLGAVWGT